MSDNESSIINNDSALPIPRQLARWLGWNEAGILQQLHWHIQEQHGQVIGGIRWIRMSETEWMEEIPLDEKAIQRAIANLVDDGLVISATLRGRCKWYAVCYEAVEALAGPVERIVQKSEKRKAARASRQDIAAKEQIVPIEQKNEVKVQNVPEGQNVPIEWVQNVPLQESSRIKDSILISSVAKEQNVPIRASPECKQRDELLDRIGELVKTNFFNPRIEPYHTSLFQTINEYSAQRVLWAIELALSPDKANGKPKTWGFILGILKKDKEGSYETQKNGTYIRHKQHSGPLQQTGEALDEQPVNDIYTGEYVYPDGRRVSSG